MRDRKTRTKKQFNKKASNTVVGSSTPSGHFANSGKTSRTKYSKFNKEFIEQIDYTNNNLSFLNKEDRIKLALKKELENGDLNLFVTHNMISEASFSSCGYQNMFIETENLFDFLMDIDIIDKGDISSQIYHAIDKNPLLDLHKANDFLGKDLFDDNVYCCNFMIYAPINKINVALAVSIFCSEKWDYEKWGDNTNNLPYTISNFIIAGFIHLKELNYSKTILDEIDFKTHKSGKFNFARKENPELNLKGVNYIKFVINTLFYMNCFKDFISNGVPTRAIIEEESKQKRQITISQDKDFFEKIEKNPHLRRGHFRTYSHDRYVYKKGQTIWIEPAMVKGHAITVKEENNLSEIKTLDTGGYV